MAHADDDGILHIEALAAGLIATFNRENVLEEEDFAAIRESRWPRAPLSSDGMNFGGFFSEGGERGILFAIAVPDCGPLETIQYSVSRWRLGFMRDGATLWFALSIGASSFDAPFSRILGDIGAECVVAASQDRTLTLVTLCFVDGRSVVAVRNARFDVDWVRALGRDLERIPYIVTAQEHEAAIRSTMDRHTTRQIIEQASMREFAER